MAKEHELALSILNESGATNPKTGKPFTLEEIQKSPEKKETLKMSAENQATVNWARKQRKNSYKSRIESCVSQGRIDPGTAKEFWQRLDGDEDLQFSFDAEGNPVKNSYDFVLEMWEKSPRNTALTGHSPTSAAKKTKIFGEHAFSLGAGVVEEEKEEEIESPLTLEQADEIVQLQFQAAGKRSSQVEGGLTTVTK